MLGFQPGDAVFAAGDVSRDGNYAEYVAVDYRLVAQKPKNQSFKEAAVIPMTFLTAWGALMRNQNHLPEDVNTVLIIGGAGGVGSAAIQLLKAKTNVTVMATASQLESQQWLKEMGADMVLDHSRDMSAQLQQHHIDKVDLIFSTRYTANHLSWIVKVLKPYGYLSLIDVHQDLDVSGLMPLSISVHLETVFARILNKFQPEKQALFLQELASMVEAGKIKSALNKSFSGLTVENIYTAHKLIEQGKAIGKIVIELGGAGA